MTETFTPQVDQIGSLLAGNGYEVTEVEQEGLRVREVESGVTVHVVLSGNILFFSLNCMTVPDEAVTAALMRKMLASDSGISTSYFQLYTGQAGQTVITLNNFCKLQDMGPEDEDDILSCVQFLHLDLLEARDVLSGLIESSKA